jgi:alpha-1,2-mannosyltransferase
MTPDRVIRLSVSLVACGIFVPPLVTGLATVVPIVVAVTLSAVLATIGVTLLASRLRSSSLEFLQHRGPLAVWIAVGLLAVTQSVRLSVFMHDVTRESYSVLPPPGIFGVVHPGFVHHACLTAYTEAAGMSRRRGVNLYDQKNYLERTCEPGHSSDCVSRKIGPIDVDPFQYPPPFLLLPRVALMFTHDFFAIRAAWFTVQMALLGLAVLSTARWIGGRTGRRALLFAPVLGIALPVLIGLQVGQFQISAFSMSMLAMVLFARGREAVGGGLLGFVTLGKVFPGVLALYLLGNRRPAAAAWTAGCAVSWTLLALPVIGTQPFADFLTYQLPKLATGEAFPWLDEPDSLPINYGTYALVMNFRSLGVSSVTHGVSSAAASAYGIVVAGLAFIAGRRLALASIQDRERFRVRQAQSWLALLTLGSLRSPFVPEAYAMPATFWLIILIAAEMPRLSWKHVATFVSLGVMFSTVLENNIPSRTVVPIVVFSLVREVLALSVNLWAVLRSLPGSPERAGVVPAAVTTGDA